MARPLIAIVDDDTLYLDLICDVLDEEGYATVCSTTSNNAVTLFSTLQPALGVLDLRMERADSGVIMLNALRQHVATAHIPLLLCSTDTRFLRERGPFLREYDCDVLEKPFSLDAFLAKVAERVPLTV